MKPLPHPVRVAHWSVACAREVGLSGEAQLLIYLAGVFHDLGKTSINRKILLKPGPLTPEEWVEVKKHPVKGAEVLAAAGWPSEVVAAVRYHHEDYCGSGYPDGLKGEEIPLFARILRVADAYDAMTSARPYKGPYPHELAVLELARSAGTRFDPEVTRVFLRVAGPFSSLGHKLGLEAAEAYLRSFVWEAGKLCALR